MLKNYLIILSVLVFSACSFKPLYSKHEDTTLESVKLGAVTFGSYSAKPDYTLRSELVSILETVSKDKLVQKKYILDVALDKTLIGFGTQQNTINTRNLAILSANYKLSDITTGKEITSGTQKIIDSFEISVSPYSTYVSDEETSIKLAKNLAHELILRLEDDIIKIEKDASK